MLRKKELGFGKLTVFLGPLLFYLVFFSPFLSAQDNLLQKEEAAEILEILPYRAQGGQGDMDLAIGRRYHQLAVGLLAKGDIHGAEEVLVAGMDWASSLSDIPAELALLFEGQGRPRYDIIDLLSQALERDVFIEKSPAAILEFRANQYFETGNYSRALADLDQLEDSESCSLLRLHIFERMRQLGLVQAQLDAPGKEPYQRALSAHPFSLDIARATADYCRQVPLRAGGQLLVETLFKRLPLLGEEDAGLYWRMSELTANFDERRRLVARSLAEGCKETGAVLAALDVGVLDGRRAVELVFEQEELEIEDLTNLWKLLRSDEERELFLDYAHHFSGNLIARLSKENWRRAIIVYEQGSPLLLKADWDGDRRTDYTLMFNGEKPISALWRLSGQGHMKDPEYMALRWSEYPAIESARIGSYEYQFSPGEVLWAPLLFPEPAWGDIWRYPTLELENSEIGSAFLLAHAIQIKRPGRRFLQSTEIISLEQGRVRKSIEMLGDTHVAKKQFSATGQLVFEDIDMDMDGSMEARLIYAQEDYVPDFIDDVYGPIPPIIDIEFKKGEQ